VGIGAYPYPQIWEKSLQKWEESGHKAPGPEQYWAGWDFKRFEEFDTPEEPATIPNSTWVKQIAAIQRQPCH